MDELRDSSLCRPLLAHRNPKLTLRIRKRWTTYVGGMAGAAVWVYAIPLAIVLCVVPTVVLIRVEETPLIMDLAWGAILVGVVGNQVMVGKGFSEGFMEFHASERGLYYRPEVVTGHYVTWLPKLLLEHRADDWRGRNGRAGFRSPNPIMWVMLPFGMTIEDIENPEDVIDLPNDPYVSDDVALLRHRSRMRQVQGFGFDKAALDQPPPSIDPDKWCYIAAVCLAIVGVAAIVMSTGGAG